MSKAFRWIGDGVLKDVVGGRVVVYMGRRIDATGHVIEGEIVRNHTIDDAKLESWVKAGRAEYVGAIENVVDKVTGAVAKTNGTSAESEREASVHQRAADHTDAVLRQRALADLRLVIASEAFDDDDRNLLEMEFAEVPTARLRDLIDTTTRERDRRLDTAKPKARARKGKKAAEAEPEDEADVAVDESEPDLDLGGAGPGGES